MGISIGGSIYASELKTKLRQVPGYENADVGAQARNDVRGLRDITPPELKQQVLHAYTRSISTIWLVMIPFAVIAFFLSLLMRKYTLKRTIVKAGAATSKPGEGGVPDGAVAAATTSTGETLVVSDARVEGGENGVISEKAGEEATEGAGPNKAPSEKTALQSSDDDEDVDDKLAAKEREIDGKTKSKVSHPGAPVRTDTEGSLARTLS